MAARLQRSGGTVVDLARGFTWQYAWDRRNLGLLELWFQAATGPKIPLTLTTTGLYTVATQADADLLVGRTVTGRVLITASNVWLRHFKVISDGTGNAAVELSGSLTGVLLEDAEIDGASLITPISGLGGSSFARCTARRLNIHHCLDRFRAHEGSTYQHIYAHHPVNTPDTGAAVHADAIQVVRAGAPVSITQCWLDSTPVNSDNVTSVVIIKTDAAAISGVTVDSCYLNGGRYSVIVEAGANGVPTNITISNNRFGHGYTQGVWSGSGIDPAAVIRTGNVFADTGTPVPLIWGLLTP